MTPPAAPARMTVSPAGTLDRWRALARLFWTAGRGKVLSYAALVAVTGFVPAGVILASGELVRSLRAAVEPGGDTTAPFVALGWMVLGLVAVALAGNALGFVARQLDVAVSLEVHDAAAAAALATPTVAPLDDPAFADELQAVREAEKRGTLRRTATELATVVGARLRGISAFVVLLGFEWWAPLALAAAWALTNVLFLKSAENGISMEMNDGATGLRRSEYLRTLALDAPAAKEVRVFGLGGWIVAGYGDAWMEALRGMWKTRGGHRLLNVAANLALLVSHVGVLYALALAASRGEITGAALLVFVQAALATADLGVVGDAQWWLAQALAVAGRAASLRARANAAPAPTVAATKALPPAGKVGISLQDVRFTYRGRPTPTLDGLTLDVPAGQSLAIVGENGAGKSTLIKLLCGLYEPDAGTIVLDGGATPLQARGRIGVIFQDFVRYPLALRENVGFGHLPLVTHRPALEASLRDAGGGELLEALPKGWDTVLSREFTDGADLSGGQWQRVALARALTAVRGGAGLLILDEPTASLDVRAETELFERFLELTRGVTTILVSHRLSSVRHADRIVVIDDGRVAEDGTHEQLMAAGGIYAHMFTLQARRFAEAELEAAEGEEVAHA